MANQKIRQEINLLNAIMSAGGSGIFLSDIVVLLDTNSYSGTPTYYLEVSASTSPNIGANDFRLRRAGTSTDDATVANTTPSTVEILRSSSFTPPAGQTEYVLAYNKEVSNSSIIYGARIVILQNETTITKTETQIEIGQFDTGRTNTSVADITNPKFWAYTAANWTGGVTFFAEAVWQTSAKNTTTISINRTSDNASRGSIVSAGSNSTGYIRSRIPFAPTDGEIYKIRCFGSTTKSNYSIVSAKVIAIQSGGDSFFNSENGVISFGQSASLEAGGQSFNASTSYDTTSIYLLINTIGSPVDNLTLEVLTGGITGTVIATSSTVNGSTITSAGVGDWIKFSFSSFSISSGTKYYLRCTRSGAVDGSNYYQWHRSTTDSLASAGIFTRNTGVWSSEGGNDAFFAVFGDSALTKLEPQYLLLNRTLGGTGDSNALTKWIASEWDAGGGTITYKHAMDSNNASNSCKLQDASNVDISGSTVTGSTQQVSSAITFSNNDVLHTNVITEAGVISASRILTIYAWATPVAERRIFITGG